MEKKNKCVTWLSQPDVEDLVHLRIVRRDVKDVVGLILDAGNIDGHQIFRDLLPSHRSGAAGAHVKHFRPQPAEPKFNRYDTMKPKLLHTHL